MPTDPVSGRWLEPPELERVIRWRREELERAGFCEEQADAIAHRPDVDLHRALTLLKDGCSVKTALRILL